MSKDDEIAPLEARDGTRWVYAPGLNIWTGWQPGEDGCWIASPAQFAEWYPELAATVEPT